MLRQAKEQDIASIVELAVESVNQENWPVTVCRRLMRAYIEEAIKTGFCWVSEKNKIHGAVVALKHDSFWFSEKQVSLLMFYCPTGGEGYKLLRMFADWVKADKEIALAVVSLESFMDKRYVRMFNRLGFTKPSPTFSYVRKRDEQGC